MRVEVFMVAGTVAYDMRGGSATSATSVTLSAGADLELLAEPFVVASGAVVVLIEPDSQDAAAGEK